MTARALLQTALKSARRINLTALPDINPDAAVLFGTVAAFILAIIFGV